MKLFFLPAALILVLLPCLPLAGAAFAATPGAAIHGHVTDPSGAVVPHAHVALTNAAGKSFAASSGAQGNFAFAHLPAGLYRITVKARGFQTFTRAGLRLRSGTVKRLRIRLILGAERKTVTVRIPSPAHISLAPSHNASAVVIRGKALQMLSNDPDELLTQLQELAGPAVGPGGPTVYIDGFSGGDLPPKSAILAVRVNRNPFSPEHSHLGYGRIDVLTKPGFAQWHGGLSLYGNAAAFNTPSPLLAGITQPAYHALLYGARLGGPLGKKTSFYFSAQRRNFDLNSLVHTDILNPSTLQTELFTTAVPNPHTLTNISIRVDRQLTATNTLMARYDYFGAVDNNNGVGGQSLPSQGYNRNFQHHLFQFSDTDLIGPNVLNQFRMQFLHFNNTQLPNQFAPALDVIGAFTGGGYSGGRIARSESHYQFENITSITLGNHQLQLGEYVREIVRGESNFNGYNGTFTFNSLSAYQTTEQDLRAGMSMAQIQAAGAGPSQFNLTAGNAYASVHRLDGAVFAGDTWKVRPNVDLSYGLRFETENYLATRAAWAPRFGLAWGLNKKTILRAGWGVFYQRLDDDQMIQVAHLNGRNETTYIVPNPAFFPSIPTAGALSVQYAATPTVYRLAPHIRAPYLMTAAASLERQVRHNLTVSVTFLHSQGQDQFLTNDVNAPLPGTFNPAVPGSGTRPLGAAAGNIYEYESQGIFRQNQIIANFNWHSAPASLFGYYMYNRAFSDTAGVNSFPANPYNLLADYGVARFGIRHRVFIGGDVALPWGVQLFPLILMRSGIPFSITLGQDLYGAGIHNARPAYATAATPPADVSVTPYGVFNVAPNPAGAIIPANTATGPAAWVVNLRLSKTFGFGATAAGRRGTSGIGGHGHHHHHHRQRGLGPGGLSNGGFGIHGVGGSDHRFALTVHLDIRNLFNHVNLGTPVGNLGSPLFGQSVSLAGGPYSFGNNAVRHIDFGVSLAF